MTDVYLVRHAQPDNSEHDTYRRPLTPQGMVDRLKVSEYLESKGIEVVISSPYVRAYDTIEPFARAHGLAIEKSLDMRERRVDSLWLSDEEMAKFTREQWENFDHRLTDGESLRETQERCISALRDILKRYIDRRIVIAGHGVAFSTILNYYLLDFGYLQQHYLLKMLPFIVHMKFSEDELYDLEIIDPLASKVPLTFEPKDTDALTLVKPEPQHEKALYDYRREIVEWEETTRGLLSVERYLTVGGWLGSVEKQEKKNSVEMLMAVRESDGVPVGLAAVRCRLGREEQRTIGNICCHVRHTERDKGYAEAILRLALERCAENGLKTALVCCEIDNENAEKAIVACGGVLENILPCAVSDVPAGLVKRYRISTEKKERL